LTNGGDTISAYRAVLGHVLREITGVQLPPQPTPPAEPKRVDAARYVGSYSCEVADYVVTQDEGGRVWLDETPKGIIAEMGAQQERSELVHFDGDTLIAAEEKHGMYQLTAFVGDDGAGNALYLHNGRATRRA
jgi:hypothetical protein